MINKAKSVLSLKNVDKVKKFIEKTMLIRASDKDATFEDSAEDLANIICYAISVMLNDETLNKSYNLIIDPQSGTPIGTPCGTSIKAITKEI